MTPPTERELTIRSANLPGWHLVGVFYEPDFPGSWLLHHGGEAMLLELPPEMPVEAVDQGLKALGSPDLRYVAASHSHEDHLDVDVWNAMIDAYPDVEYLSPDELEGDTRLELGEEPVWLIKAPKHSPDDVVTVFRGVAMTGDIETTKLDSVLREVPVEQRRASMDYLREFPRRSGYHIHTKFSAHLNSLHRNVDWNHQFSYWDYAERVAEEASATAAGRKAGRKWAQDRAEPIQLQRLSERRGPVHDWHFGSGSSADTSAEKFYLIIEPSALREDAEAFWGQFVKEPDFADTAFVQGFALAAIKVWGRRTGG